MQPPRLITAATELPVSLEELKAHCAVSADTEDATLSAKLAAATEWLAGELGRAFITSTWEIALPCFPHGRGEWGSATPSISLPLGNLQTVDSINYRDSTGAVTPLTNFRAYGTYDPADGTTDMGIGRVIPVYGATWPTETLDVGEPVTIRFTCGWADAASVPTPIKQAICMVAEHFRRNPSAELTGRGLVSVEVALGVARLTSRYEDRRF